MSRRCLPSRRKSGRGLKLRPTAIGAAAEQLGLPCYWPETLNAADTQDQLAAFKADLFVVVAYGLLLPQALDIPVLWLCQRACLAVAQMARGRPTTGH